jgi:cytochrome P450
VLCRLAGDDGDTFSDRDVVNHMVFLLMAAHDTSTLTTSTILDQLGRHPEWQDRVRAESLALPEHPTLDELDTLTSLDLVIKEALRLVPPVPVLARRTVKETEVLGVRVPADQLVAVMLHHSHHDPAIWTDPDRFDPERFAEHRREDKRHRAAWEPFGGGVHKCLGLFFAGM